MFVETTVFTRRIRELELEAELRLLQYALLREPTVGAMESGTGGLRKIRIGNSAQRIGKRSGGRVHYLWLPAHDVIYLLHVFAKSEQPTLTPLQKRRFATVVAQIKTEWDAS